MNNHNEENKMPIVLRLLNTAMSGCEYPLTQKTLFIVAGEEKLASVAGNYTLHETSQVFYIPGPEGDASINFEIELPSTLSCLVRIRELSETETKEHEVEFQKAVQIGGVTFALRHENDSWDDGILNHNSAEKINTLSAENNRMKVAVAAGIILLIGLITAGSLLWLNSQNRQLTTLSEQISPGVTDFRIFNGRNGTKYVLVSSERDYHWVKQSLVKMPTDFPVQVLTRKSLEDQLSQRLNRQWPELGIRRLDFNDAGQPCIVLGSQHRAMTAEQQQEIQSALQAQLFWKEKVIVLRQDDRQLEAAADKVTASVRGSVEKIRLADKLTYRITGELDDAQLQNLKEGITNFDALWGHGYVNFIISQKHDWLKDKSFKYGDDGYIKIKPGHWYFSKPTFQE